MKLCLATSNYFNAIIVIVVLRKYFNVISCVIILNTTVRIKSMESIYCGRLMGKNRHISAEVAHKGLLLRKAFKNTFFKENSRKLRENHENSTEIVSYHFVDHMY